MTGCRHGCGTVLRLLLAAAMFYFGMAKVIPTQMPFVLNRLVEPYGNFSPTGALGAQVGISQLYQMLLGAAEVLAGQLLLLPRMAAVLALVCAFDLTQVFILNMTYDKVGVVAVAVIEPVPACAIRTPTVRGVVHQSALSRPPNPCRCSPAVAPTACR
jgi:hypothetical protein